MFTHDEAHGLAHWPDQYFHFHQSALLRAALHEHAACVNDDTQHLSVTCCPLPIFTISAQPLLFCLRYSSSSLSGAPALSFAPPRPRSNMPYVQRATGRPVHTGCDTPLASVCSSAPWPRA